MESSTELLNQFSEQLRTENAQRLRRRCQALVASGVEFDEIARLIWDHVAEKSVADYSWLPAASCVNHADMAAQVELQSYDDKHAVMTFGEPIPEFRRTEVPPPLEGSLDELRSRLNDISASNDWLLTERCLLGIAKHSDAKTTLRCIIEHYVQPYREDANQSAIAPEHRNRHFDLFGNIESLVEFHERILARDLQVI